MLICHLQFSFLSPKFETKLRNGAKQNTPFEFYPKFRWGGSNLWLISDCPCEPREPGRWQLRHACSMLSSILFQYPVSVSCICILYLYPVSVSLYQYPVICIPVSVYPVSVSCISLSCISFCIGILSQYPVSVFCIIILYQYPVSFCTDSFCQQAYAFYVQFVAKFK